MQHSSRRRMAALVGSLLAILTIAAPAAANAELGHSGTVGVHALRDSPRKPGATCVYSQPNLWFLKIRPPKVFASSGRQTVGWRFIVERQPGTTDDVLDWTKTGPYRVTYRSPIARAVATTTTPAPFSWREVEVDVPESSERSNSHRYRISVRMFWFGSDGRTLGSALHRIGYYWATVGIFDAWLQENFCDAFIGYYN